MSGIRFGRSGNGYASTQVMLSAADDWRGVHDSHERRKIQNRLAQRNYRRKLRERMSELEAKANATTSVVTDFSQLPARGSPTPRRASNGSRYKTTPNPPRRGTVRRASAPQTNAMGMTYPQVTVTAPYSPPMPHPQDSEMWSPATATPVTPLDRWHNAQFPTITEQMYPSARLAHTRAEPRFIPAPEQQYNPDLEYSREHYSPTMDSPEMWVAPSPVVKTEDVEIPVSTAGLVGLGMCCAPENMGAYTATAGWVGEQNMGQQAQQWAFEPSAVWDEEMTEQMQHLGSPQADQYWGA